MVKNVAESIVEDRKQIPVKYTAILEGMDSSKQVSFTKEEVEELLGRFPDFDVAENAVEVLGYFGSTWSFVLSEEEGGECFVSWIWRRPCSSCEWSVSLRKRYERDLRRGMLNFWARGYCQRTD